MIKFNDEQIKSMRDGNPPPEYDFEEAITSLSYEVAELRKCLEQAYGDKIGTYTMKGNEVERWRKALRKKGGEK